MSQLLLIHENEGTLSTLTAILRKAGYDVVARSSAEEGLALLQRQRIDMVLSDLRLPDMFGLDLLRTLVRHWRHIPCIVVTATCSAQAAIEAIRVGAADLVQTPINESELLDSVRAVLLRLPGQGPAGTGSPRPLEPEMHAASRWARALIRIIDSPKDPCTIAEWGKFVYAAPGTIRNWCRTAGVSPRRSLVLARLLRVAALSDHGRHRPENLLDVVDKRTLEGLIRLAGLTSWAEFPTNVDDFLERQTLVRDADTVRELSRMLNYRHSSERHELLNNDRQD